MAENSFVVGINTKSLSVIMRSLWGCSIQKIFDPKTKYFTLAGSDRINPELQTGERCTAKKVLNEYFIFVCLVC
jgi:hypothetical protein